MCIANFAAVSQVCKGYIMLVERSLIILLFKDTDLNDQVDTRNILILWFINEGARRLGLFLTLKFFH